MKVFLLAGGLGTRLRPLTEHTPKCLVPVQGRPLIDYWFDLFDGSGVDEVLINLHHLPDQVEAHFENHPWQDRVRFFHEPELLGSAGTVRANRDFVGNEDFLVCYADNLTDTDLSVIWQRHQRGDAVLTMGLFHTPFPKECGIATLDDAGRIIEFIEKPEHPQSDLANEVIVKNYYNLGIAVDTERGLMVPVIKDVDSKDLFQLAAELTSIGERARTNKIGLDELQGGTFTVTNLGSLGVGAFTPIVNHPEVAILGLGRGVEEAVVNNGRIEPRLMMPIALSYDHRVIDGADGARFVRKIVDSLENPELMLLGG